MLPPIQDNHHDFDHIDYLNLSENGNLKNGRQRCYTPQKHKDTSSLSCVGMWWSFLSFISLLLSLISFFMPYWLQGSILDNSLLINSQSASSASAFSSNRDQRNYNINNNVNHNDVVFEVNNNPVISNFSNTYFGLWKRCNYHTLTADGYIEVSHTCGRYSTFIDIPSIWWQIASVLMAIGSLLTMMVSFFGLLACCVTNVMSRSVAKAVGLIQFTSGLLLGLGCVLFPFGWENNLDLVQACGPNTSAYRLGDCKLGWAFWMAVSGAALTLCCSILGCYSAKKNKRLRYDRVGL